MAKRGRVPRVVSALLLAFFAAGVAAPLHAQTTLPPVDETTISDRRTYDRQQHYWHFTGRVEMERGDTKVFADNVEVWTDEDRAVASGNVVFSQGANRIAADRAEFNTRTRLGTFFNASGIATVQPPRRSAVPGAFAPPPLAGQDTDVYFFGEKVDKIGTKKYRISNGGFTTCLQPTPRWSLSANTVILNIDHYTFLRQAVFDVKGVPMFYLPILYYPTKEDQRATGFLIPTYGSSSLRGQAIHNAFFWAINRSHDATVLHDWF
jgi:LPS-assembly protein